MALKEVQTALERVQSLEHVAGYVCMTSTGTPSSSSFFDRLGSVVQVCRFEVPSLRNTPEAW